MHVRHVQPVDTHDLRRRVLRDGRPDAEVVFPGDEHATHFAAFGEGAAPLAIASLYAAPLKEPAWWGAVAPAHQYQFRGMASAPEARGRGFADAVMRAMISDVRDRTPATEHALLWCNARLAAVGFYRRFGMGVVSPGFQITGVGPHVVMTVPLSGTEG
ncbi:MAG: GNAT family N-acetyltransferase [Phycisphaerales bacterium]